MKVFKLGYVMSQTVLILQLMFFVRPLHMSSLFLIPTFCVGGSTSNDFAEL